MDESLIKQSVWYTFWVYMGLLIGGLSTLFLYPYDLELYGALRYILPMAEFMVLGLFWGMPHALVRFFPKYQNQTIVFFGYSLLGAFLLAILFEWALWLWPIKNTQFWHYRHYILALALILGLIDSVTKLLSNYGMVSLSGIMERSMPKIYIAIWWGAYMLQWITANQFLGAVIASFWLGGLWYMSKLLVFYPYNQWRQHWPIKGKRKVSIYAIFTVLSITGGFLFLRIDHILIGEWLGLKANGVYGIYTSLLSFITAITTGLYLGLSPQISDKLQNKNHDWIQDTYQRVSLLVLGIGILIFGALWINYNAMASILNNSLFVYNQYTFLILGLGSLINLSSSFDTIVYLYSKHYRWHIGMLIGMVLLNGLLNYYFVKRLDYNIFGTALATLISIVIYTILKWVGLYHWYKLNPYSWKTIQYGLVLAITIVLFWQGSPNRMGLYWGVFNAAYVGVSVMMVRWMFPDFFNQMIKGMKLKIS